MADEIWSVALLLTDGKSSAMTLTVAAGTEQKVTDEAVSLALKSHPGMEVSEALAHGVLDDR